MMDLLIIILQQVIRFFALRFARFRPVLVPVYSQPVVVDPRGRALWVHGYGGVETGGVRVASPVARLAGCDPAMWGHPLAVRPLLTPAARQSRCSRAPAVDLRLRRSR